MSRTSCVAVVPGRRARRDPGRAGESGRAPGGIGRQVPVTQWHYGDEYACTSATFMLAEGVFAVVTVCQPAVCWAATWSSSRIS